ncbi:MAG: hypothetical protein OSA99_15390 [Acidimicrobiales bacterium]|nr:hypothetical protein [Acidimicrobiales bacterium]
MRAITATLLALALAGVGCDSDRRAISRDDLPDVPAEATVSVELGDDGFDVEELQLTTADLVEFRVVGDENHGVRTDDYTIDTGPLFPGESTDVIFDKPGRYVVIDTADDTATIDVAVDEAVSP